MTIGAPQIVWIALTAISVGIAIARFGTPKTDKYNFTDVIIGPLICNGILWWGGFYG